MSDEEEWGEESTHSSGGDSDWDSSWRVDESEEDENGTGSDVDESEEHEEGSDQRSAKAAGGGTAAGPEGRGSRSTSIYRGT